MTPLKKIVFFSSLAILVALFALLMMQHKATPSGAKKTGNSLLPSVPPKVFYIPGWKTKDIPQDKQAQLLKEMFPNSQIEIKKWESEGDFLTVRKRADEFAAILADEICNLAAVDQQNLILIGHSLGGRIAIRTMAILAHKQKPILRGIFLAAAIPHDDPDIASAIKNSYHPNINIYNRQDYTLRHIYGVYGEGLKDALGAYGYAFPFSSGQMLQFENTLPPKEILSTDDYMDQLKNHESISYITFLRNCMGKINSAENNLHAVDYSTARENINRIQVKHSNPPMKIVDIGWETLDSVSGWRLQRRPRTRVSGERFRIVDPLDYQRANGDAEKMRESFEDIKTQLHTASESKEPRL